MIIRTNDLIIAGVGIGVSLLAVYLISGKKQKPEKDEPVLKEREDIQKVPKSMQIKKTIPEDNSVTSKPEEKPWLLSKGSKGKEVERLQIWLLRNHGWKGTITKVFDEQTERLVQKIFKTDSVDKETYDKNQMGIPIHELIKA